MMGDGTIGEQQERHRIWIKGNYLNYIYIYIYIERERERFHIYFDIISKNKYLKFKYSIIYN